jgi:Ca2+-binding RTX toxin-like protein
VLGANVENLVLLDAGGNINGTGNALANQISGNSGANRIAGGLGNDTLTGGGGADRFFFNTAPSAATNVDHVTDFLGGGADLLLLENAVFVGLVAGLPLNPVAFASGAGLTGGQDANDRIVYDTTTGALYYDANGSAAGGSTPFAVLDGAPALTADDFLVT